MRSSRMTRRLGLAAVLLAVGAAAADGVDAVSKPSQDVTLSFTRPGRIREVLVKEGQEVKAGDPLVQLDNSAEQVEADRLKAQAQDQVRIKAAEAQLAQKKNDLLKVEKSAKSGASSEQEVEHARVEVVIAELSVDLAKFEHKQEKLKYDEARLQVDRMRLTSPIAGKVEKLSYKAGESADALKEVVRVVNIDALWVEAPVPTVQARRLKVGQSAEVEFPETDAGRQAIKARGKIIHMAAVADAASDTLIVRIEAPNPSGRPAGEHVKVRFPAEPAAQSPGK